MLTDLVTRVKLQGVPVHCTKVDSEVADVFPSILKVDSEVDFVAESSPSEIGYLTEDLGGDIIQ